MSGGFLIARDDGLYDRAAHVLGALGGVAAIDALGGRVVQLIDKYGHVFTLYERVPAGTEWEVREGTVMAAKGVQPPEMNLVVACPFECRWPDLVARLCETVARTTEAPTWVLDGDGVIWSAKAVDPRAVRL